MRKEKKISTGLYTIVLGIVLYIGELLYLPTFALAHKDLVNGQGFYTDYMQYIGMQPYPLVFLLTFLIVLMGILMVIWGVRTKDEK